MKITFVSAPEAGSEPLLRLLPARLPDGDYLIASDKNWVTYLAGLITDNPDYVDNPTFLKDLGLVKNTMDIYDKVFYIPIYAWNVVDLTDVDEDRRVLIDYNIVKIINSCGIDAITVPEGPSWDRARFVLDMVE